MRAIAIAVASLTLLSVSSVMAAPAAFRDSGTRAVTAVQATDFSAAKKRKKHVRSTSPSPQSNFETVRGMTHGAERAQVACTRAGCQGVPRGCLREPERSFSGDPTGFDSIVCPAR